MKTYDIIVIGSGCGMIIVDEATSHGLKVALVDKGPLGGTCLNLGCIPSKMLIHTADRVVDIQEADKLGIHAEIKSKDFGSIMKRMRKSIKESQKHIRGAISESENLHFYEGEGHFIGDYTIAVNGDKIKGKKIFIASGSRPFIPPIKGLDSIEYLTNETTLQLTRRPESLIIIGGGYIGVEYAHFFAAMGTTVTIIELFDRLVTVEEPEISDLLKKQLSERMEIYTGTQADEVKQDNQHNSVTVMVTDKKTSIKKEITAQKLMIAVGRRSNADLLKAANTGVETDQRGYIKVNEFLETGKKHIYAIGDANGRQMFTHAANRQSALVAYNVFHRKRIPMDFSIVPHAVYSHPQIASVGLTEENARKEHDIVVGKTRYAEVAKGEAMMETEGFAKAIVEKESEKILGFHIIGPYAPELIQEVTNAIMSGGHIPEINNGIHIHPALSELVAMTVNSV